MPVHIYFFPLRFSAGVVMACTDLSLRNLPNIRSAGYIVYGSQIKGAKTRIFTKGGISKCHRVV